MKGGSTMEPRQEEEKEKVTRTEEKEANQLKIVTEAQENSIWERSV
jgi:hypothetical protein